MTVLSILLVVTFLVQVRCVCEGPVPDERVDVLETETAGKVVFRMRGGGKNDRWHVTIVKPLQHLDWLERYFTLVKDLALSEWTLVLAATLDMEDIYEQHKYIASSNVIQLQLVCHNEAIENEFIRFLSVKPVSEFDPKFHSDVIKLKLPENHPLIEPFARLRKYVTDKDVFEGGDISVFYETEYTKESKSSHQVLQVDNKGRLWLLRKLDYDRGDNVSFCLNVTVQDVGSRKSSAIVEIQVTNVNDETPFFTRRNCDHDCQVYAYNATIFPNDKGLISEVYPEAIAAYDADNDTTTFQFLSGSPKDFRDYLTIEEDGSLLILQSLMAQTNITHFMLVVQVCDDAEPDSAQASQPPVQCEVATLFISIVSRSILFPQLPTTVTRRHLRYNPATLKNATIVLSIIFAASVLLICGLAKSIRAREDKPHVPHLHVVPVKELSPRRLSLTTKSKKKLSVILKLGSSALSAVSGPSIIEQE